MFRALVLCGACAIVAMQVVGSNPARAQGYERPPVLSPGQLLPPDLISSPYHRIVGNVPIDNFMATYQMQTKWGTFPVTGTDLLKVRIKEAAATAQIEQIDSGQTLVTSAGKTALKPLNTAKDLVTAPGQTIGDTVKGVGNFFGRVDASMSATDPNREGTIASLSGGSKARRKLAFDFGVDPYTTFDPLGALALEDGAMVRELLEQIGDVDGLGVILDELAKAVPVAAEPPPRFVRFSEPLETAYCCPRCGFEWSGEPKPGKVEPS